MRRRGAGVFKRGPLAGVWVLGGAKPLVQPFVSTIINKLDAKGRVSVPAPFRQILAQQNLRGVYCIPSFVSPALEAFGETLLAQVQERLKNFDPLFSEDYDTRPHPGRSSRPRRDRRACAVRRARREIPDLGPGAL